MTELEEYLLNLLLLGKYSKDDVHIRKLVILTYEEETQLYSNITNNLKEILFEELKRK